MSEVEKIIKLVQKYKYDNPFAEPRKIYMSYSTYLKLKQECAIRNIICELSNVSAIFGMTIIVVPDNYYLLED